MVLLSIISSGSYFTAFLIILFSVVAASYYLKLIRNIHFDSSNVTDNNVDTEGRINQLFSYTIASLTLFLLLFFINPSFLLNSLSLLTFTLFNT
jgi:NADH-ubiquinone oxidoreductase chain 2